jgi:hypothetical protein
VEQNIQASFLSKKHTNKVSCANKLGKGLARPWDPCEIFLGGGYKLCGKYKSCFCLCCLVKLMSKTRIFSQKSPVCNRQFTDSNDYRRQQKEVSIVVTLKNRWNPKKSNSECADV